MGCVYVLVGQVASGKSTYANRAAENGCIILSDDSIIAMLHGGKDSRYQRRLKPLYKAVESTILCTALGLGETVVIDRPNESRLTRARYVSLARALGREAHAIVFPRQSPEEHARRRHASDSRGRSLDWWLHVTATKDRRWEDPEKTEGFASMTYVEDKTQ